MSNVNPKEAAKLMGVTVKTLRRWEKDGKIDSLRTEGNHRRYKIEQNSSNKKYIYARVSSRKQSEDLKRQISFLKEKFPGYKVIRDIGSGINFKRKGFKFILDELFSGNIKELAIASPDRFCRFGFEMFQYIFGRFGAEIKVANGQKDKPAETELAEDLLSIITVFAARYYGSRKYKILSQDKNISV